MKLTALTNAGLALFIATLATTHAGAAPSLTLEPAQRLLFEPGELVVSGALPGAAVTLTATLIDDKGQAWSSTATYHANSQGTVNPAQQAAVRGTYTGIDARGLYWSMLPLPADQLIPTPARAPDWPSRPALSPEQPAVITVTALVPASLSDRADTELRATHELAFLAPGVRRVPVEDEPFEGVLYEAAGSGPKPAVMVITGSGGGAPERAAALLASHGITALALAHFNYPGRPDELVNIPLEYFYTAADWLRDRTGAPRIGLTGGSRGGEGALLLAAMNPAPFAAVVAGVPSNVRWGGCCSPEASAAPAWTWRGEPLDGFRESEEYGEWQEEDMPVDYVRMFLGGMLEPGEAVIPVERIEAPVLLLSGDSDELWPSAVAGEQVLARLRAHDFAYPAEHIAYPGAGHVASSQGLVTSLSDRVVHPVTGTEIPLGGTAALNAAAMVDAFARKVAFFKEHLTAATP